MNFRIEQLLAAPAVAVVEALVDADFIAATAELPKVGGAQLLDQHRDGTHVRQRIRYRFTGDLSSAVTAVVDRDRLTWVEETDYDLATHRGEHRIVPDHYGNRLEASYSSRLDADGGATTRRTAEGTVTVRMPLVGGRVERAIVSGLEEHAEAEAAFLERWVAREG